MPKFNPGDVVRRTHDRYNNMVVGDTDVVVSCASNKVELKNCGTGHDPKVLTLVTHPTTERGEAIILNQDGVEIDRRPVAITYKRTIKSVEMIDESS